VVTSNTLPCASKKEEDIGMGDEYLGKEAHDLPLLLDPEGEGRLVGPQEVFSMARDQLIDDGDTTVLATWMTL
jgi:hypothetical protein